MCKRAFSGIHLACPCVWVTGVCVRSQNSCVARIFSMFFTLTGETFILRESTYVRVFVYMGKRIKGKFEIPKAFLPYVNYLPLPLLTIWNHFNQILVPHFERLLVRINLTTVLGLLVKPIHKNTTHINFNRPSIYGIIIKIIHRTGGY